MKLIIGYATREIQYFINALREDQSKRICLSKSKPDAQKGEDLFAETSSAFRTWQVEWQPASQLHRCGTNSGCKDLQDKWHVSLNVCTTQWLHEVLAQFAFLNFLLCKCSARRKCSDRCDHFAIRNLFLNIKGQCEWYHRNYVVIQMNIYSPDIFGLHPHFLKTLQS